MYGANLVTFDTLKHPLENLTQLGLKMSELKDQLRTLDQELTKQIQFKQKTNEQKLLKEVGHDLFSIYSIHQIQQDTPILVEKILKIEKENGKHYEYIARATLEELNGQQQTTELNLDEILNVATKRHKYENRQLDVSIKNPNKYNLKGSTAKIYKFLFNALGNAYEHGKATTVNIQILEGTLLGKQSHIIKITDNGKGFPINRFDLHHKGISEKTTTTNLGLGMYMMNKIAVAHGGILRYGRNTVQMEFPQQQPTKNYTNEILDTILSYKLTQ